jgi:hypothetical protein
LLDFWITCGHREHTVRVRVAMVAPVMVMRPAPC